MPEKINSLTRISKILGTMDWGADSKVKIITLWEKVFEIDYRMIEIDHQLFRTNKVIQKLILLDQELTKAEQEITDREKDGIIQPAAFTPIFSIIRNDLLNHETIFQDKGGIKGISNEHLGVLSMGSQLLDHEEDLITEELNNLKNEVINLWNKISADPKLPKEVKAYVGEQLSHILTAIEDYKIIGIRTFQNNYPNFFATVIKNNETVKNDKTILNLTKEIGGFWKKGMSYADKAQKTITKVKGYLGTGEDVGEISQKIIDLF